jgi:hypothetical protein
MSRVLSGFKLPVARTTTISLQIFCSDKTHRSILSSSLPQIRAATKRGCVLICVEHYQPSRLFAKTKKPGIAPRLSRMKNQQTDTEN